MAQSESNQPAGPRVGIVMGSDSDWDVMRRCADQLEALEVPFEVRVISAHRTPEIAREYAAAARQRGLKVIVAGAGMAAHLAGALAATCPLPIIGVPLVSGSLGGFDALLATVQMPPGVPVATVALGPAGATNAAILAGQILALADAALAKRIDALRAAQTARVVAKDQQLSRG